MSQLLTLTTDGVARVVSFQEPALFPMFDLPPFQPAASPAAMRQPA